ncbi:hypothetical protein FS837_003390 [Tulasnella sp. UAMH 9824]|nr:hypothetical protein FS837_003390 [Tulasnella sp. UAMH 9824]
METTRQQRSYNDQPQRAESQLEVEGQSGCAADQLVFAPNNPPTRNPTFGTGGFGVLVELEERGSTKTCVKGLPPPSLSPNPTGPTADGSVQKLPLYIFSNSAEPFQGHYLPIRRAKGAKGGDEWRLENILIGGGDRDASIIVPECLDDHISVGANCPELEEFSPSNSRNDGKLDLVWVYANTSDPLHRFYYHSSSPPPPPPTSQGSRHPASKEPREFDELRYSIRSVLTNFQTSAGQLTVIAPDYPFPGCGRAQKEWTLGQ